MSKVRCIWHFDRASLKNRPGSIIALATFFVLFVLLSLYPLYHEAVEIPSYDKESVLEAYRAAVEQYDQQFDFLKAPFSKTIDLYRYCLKTGKTEFEFFFLQSLQRRIVGYEGVAFAFSLAEATHILLPIVISVFIAILFGDKTRLRLLSRFCSRPLIFAETSTRIFALFIPFFLAPLLLSFTLLLTSQTLPVLVLSENYYTEESVYWALGWRYLLTLFEAVTFFSFSYWLLALTHNRFFASAFPAALTLLLFLLTQKGFRFSFGFYGELSEENTVLYTAIPFANLFLHANVIPSYYGALLLDGYAALSALSSLFMRRHFERRAAL